jgi:hypothetical protein
VLRERTTPLTFFDTYDVTGIGMRKSAEIAYLVERDFLTANSTLLMRELFLRKFFILC